MLLPPLEVQSERGNRFQHERQQDGLGSPHRVYLLRLRLPVKGVEVRKQISVLIEIL